MLILTRKLHEAIVIDDDIEVTVHQVEIGGQVVKGARVRLCIVAPGRPVLRKEIHDEPHRRRPPERCT